MTVSVVRRPIFDRTRRTAFYELALRRVARDGLAPVDADPASPVVMDMATALIRAGDAARRRRLFLDVPRATLVRHHPAIVPGPSTAVVVAVTNVPDLELLGVCRALRRAGCLIALDDVGPGRWSTSRERSTPNRCRPWAATSRRRTSTSSGCCSPSIAGTPTSG
jgi:c-di-GMP-related signal transduction protein